jgi:hypothetical protein
MDSLKFHKGLPCPKYSSMTCGQATPETAVRPFQERPALRPALRPSPTALETPRRAPMVQNVATLVFLHNLKAIVLPLPLLYDWNFPCQTLKISKVSGVVMGS